MNNIGLIISSGCVLNDLSSGLKIPGTPLISCNKTSVSNGSFATLGSNLDSKSKLSSDESQSGI